MTPAAAELAQVLRQGHLADARLCPAHSTDMSGSAEPEGVDWQWVERLVALCQHTQAVLPETKSALKGALRSADARTVLVTLTVCALRHCLFGLASQSSSCAASDRGCRVAGGRLCCN